MQGSNNNQNTTTVQQQQTQQQQTQQDSNVQIKASSINKSDEKSVAPKNSNSNIQQQTQQNQPKNQTTRAQYAIQQINKMFSTLFDYLKKLTNVFSRNQESKQMTSEQKKEAFSLVKECKSILTKLRDIFSKIFTKNKSIDASVQQQSQMDETQQQNEQKDNNNNLKEKDQNSTQVEYQELQDISHISQSNNNLNQETVIQQDQQIENKQYSTKDTLDLAKWLDKEIKAVKHNVKDFDVPEQNSKILAHFASKENEHNIEQISHITGSHNATQVILGIKDDLHQGKNNIVEKIEEAAAIQKQYSRKN